MDVLHNVSRDSSAPLLHDETTKLDGWAYQKLEPRPSVKFFKNPRYYISFLVIFGQSVILIFGWTFFAVSISRPIPLPDSTAEWVRHSPQTVTMVSTLIASALSTVSGFLYTRAIRYSLAAFLDDRVSLYTVAAAIKVAQKSPIFNIAKIKWTISALICSMAAAAQTASWSTLLTPKTIQWPTPMSGFELDMAASSFAQLAAANQRMVNPDLLTNVAPLVEASGATAVGALVNLPSILNFNQLSYINSTSGILPANLKDLYSVLGGNQTILPANIHVDNLENNPAGFPSMYTVTQQGFTSSIVCQETALSSTTSPSLQVSAQTQTIFNTSLTVARLSVLCTGQTTVSSTAPILTSSTVDAVFAISCPTTDATGEKGSDLIILGSGIYNFIPTTVCHVIPRVTRVDVDYNDATNFFNSSFPSFINGSQPYSSTNTPWIGEFALAMFLRGLALGQSISGNSVGDTLSSFVVQEKSKTSPISINNILEEYIRGVLEFSATLLRTVYTQSDNGLFPGNSKTIPENMRISTNGTYNVQTMGWHQARDTAPGVLLAPTLILTLSIAIVVVTLIWTANPGNVPIENLHFDPGKILHVIQAASSGGLNVEFPPYNVNSAQFSDTISVRMAHLGNGKTGLIG